VCANKGSGRWKVKWVEARVVCLERAGKAAAAAALLTLELVTGSQTLSPVHPAVSSTVSLCGTTHLKDSSSSSSLMLYSPSRRAKGANTCAQSHTHNHTHSLTNVAQRNARETATQGSQQTTGSAWCTEAHDTRCTVHQHSALCCCKGVSRHAPAGSPALSAAAWTAAWKPWCACYAACLPA
jgi:hypothetical protein